MKTLRLLALLVGLVAAPVLAQTATPQPGESHEIAFAAGNPGEQMDIFVLNVDTREMRNLTNSPGFEHFLAWSPLGEQLAYTTSLTGNADYNMYVMNVDTGKVNLIAANGIWESVPLWSPDGKTIYYVANEGQSQAIYSIAVSDKIPQKILSLHTILNPVLSPDGKQIAFHSEKGITVLDIVTGNTHHVTDAARRDVCCNIDAVPSWSPDGARIAFVSNRDDGQYDIYVMDSDGENILQLTDDLPEDISPQWMPDGKHIIFASNQNGGYDYDIYSVGVQDRDIQPFTDQEMNYHLPAITPDGRRAAFVVSRESLPDLYLVDVKSKNKQQLTNSEYEYIGMVAWRPVPTASGE